MSEPVLNGADPGPSFDRDVGGARAVDAPGKDEGAASLSGRPAKAAQPSLRFAAGLAKEREAAADFVGAAAIWTDLIARFPRDPVVHIGLARCEIRRGRVDEALHIADTVRDTLQFGPGAQASLCGVYSKAGDYHAALVLLEPQLTSADPPVHAFRTAAACHLHLGNRSRALALAEEGFRRSPDNPHLLGVLLSARLACGDFDGAIALHDLLERADDAAAKARARMVEAAANLAFVRALRRHVEVISLGQQCLGWSVPNRWGVRNHFWLDDRRMPFNQAVHSGDAVIELIERDFAGYTDPANLRIRKGSSGRPVVSNPRNRVLFNHEDGRGWAENGAARLRSDYDQRVNNFRALVRGNACLFLYSLHVTADVGRLERALAQVAGHDDFRILALDHRREREPLPESAHVRVVDAALPNENYVWHRHFNTSAGLRFERGIIAEIRTALSRF
jgi:tetratricopeptide (TPR) repeat protein